MTLRLLLVFLVSAVSASAQSTAFGTKAAAAAPAPAEPTATAAAKTTAKGAEEEVDVSVVITPFRSLTPPEAKTSRTFQLSKLNKPGCTETTKELRLLYSEFANQRIVDGSPAGSSRATGYIATVNYALIQDLGGNRFLAKAAWPPAGPNDVLAAGADTMAILLLAKPAKVGDAGKLKGMHVGTVALLFTAAYPPLTGKRLTLRREAFVECDTLEDSPAGLTKFAELIGTGAEVSVITDQKVACKKCGGFGQIREPQKGSLIDKLTPCAECTKGKVTIAVETKFIP